MENTENVPTSIEEAVETTINSDNLDGVVQYLKAQPPEEITEFCFQMHEIYQKGDKTGLIQLGRVIEDLLKRI